MRCLCYSLVLERGIEVLGPLTKAFMVSVTALPFQVPDMAGRSEATPDLLPFIRQTTDLR